MPTGITSLCSGTDGSISRDGFVNNKETLQLSPLLLEAYFDIAGQALERALVDLDSPPQVQKFTVELGRQINDNFFGSEQHHAFLSR